MESLYSLRRHGLHGDVLARRTEDSVSTTGGSLVRIRDGDTRRAREGEVQQGFVNVLGTGRSGVGG